MADRMPTIKITNPLNNSKVTSPIDITGAATFRPTLSATKGTIAYKYTGPAGVGNYTKYCAAENCTLSYKDDIAHTLAALPLGGPHTVTLTACAGGACASDISVFTVTDCAVITRFDASPKSFTATGGGAVTLTGNITAPSGTIKWRIDVAGRSLTGTGNTATAVWDGRDANGNIPAPGTYQATLTAWIDGNSGCPEDKKELTYTVKAPPENQCSAPIIEFGSKANVASGNLNHDQLLFSVAGAKHIKGCTLTYNSADSYAGVLGKGWTHSFNMQLIAQPGDTYTVRDGDGSTVSLIKNGEYYAPETSAYPSLQRTQTGPFSCIIKTA